MAEILQRTIKDAKEKISKVIQIQIHILRYLYSALIFKIPSISNIKNQKQKGISQTGHLFDPSESSRGNR